MWLVTKRSRDLAPFQNVASWSPLLIHSLYPISCTKGTWLWFGNEQGSQWLWLRPLTVPEASDSAQGHWVCQKPMTLPPPEANSCTCNWRVIFQHLSDLPWPCSRIFLSNSDGTWNICILTTYMCIYVLLVIPGFDVVNGQLKTFPTVQFSEAAEEAWDQKLITSW